MTGAIGAGKENSVRPRTADSCYRTESEGAVAVGSLR